ncbi:MAG: HD domain-containing protein [Nitrospiraceae bacterium]|nr:HD domain-containing protein [Nitrospiraceae bacterium]
MEYTPRIVDAFAFAYELHKKQVRKQSHVPYITHLMAAAATVGGHAGDEDQFIAALLHDAAEDQGGAETLNRIRERFGDAVAGYVAACSDSYDDPRPPWHERKGRFLEGVADADPKLKLVVAADKLHNARSIVSDLHERGNDVWRMFKAGRESTLWYYGEVVRALAKDWTHPVLRELGDAVDLMQRVASELGAEE